MDAPHESTVLIAQPKQRAKKRSAGPYNSGIWAVVLVAGLATLAILALALITVLGGGSLDDSNSRKGSRRGPVLGDRTRLERDSIGRFIHITDLHIDPHYVEGSTTYSACHRLPASGSDVEAAKRKGDGHKRTGRFGISEAKCDTPVALVNATSEYLQRKWAQKVDFVIWTGDSGRHDNDAEVPRTFDEIVEQNEIGAEAMRRAFGATPVVPNIGNNDISPHNELARPGRKTARRTFQELARTWAGLIPKDQLPTFLYGGYFAADVVDYDHRDQGNGVVHGMLNIPKFKNRPRKPDGSRPPSTGITVLSLNTIYWYRANAKVGGCNAEDSPGLAQLAWIRYQMRRARQRNRDLILMGHVMPTGDSYRPTCYRGYARTVTQIVPAPPLGSDAEPGAVPTKNSGAGDLPRVLAQLYGHSNVDLWSFVGHEPEVSSAAGSGDANDKRLWWEREVDEESGRFGKLIRDVWSTDSSSNNSSNSSNSSNIMRVSERLAAMPHVGEREWEDMEDDIPHASAIKQSRMLPGNFVDSLLKDFEHVLVQPERNERLGVTMITPSIIPKYFPGFRVFHYLKDEDRAWEGLARGTLIDYDVYWANLPKLNSDGAVGKYDIDGFFRRLYRFSEEYAIPDLSPESYIEWARKLVSEKAFKKKFRSLAYMNTK